MSEKYVFPIEAYKQGIDEERKRIVEWIKLHRTCFDEESKMYRDHFTSENLLAFIEKDPQ